MWSGLLTRNDYYIYIFCVQILPAMLRTISQFFSMERFMQLIGGGKKEEEKKNL